MLHSTENHRANVNQYFPKSRISHNFHERIAHLTGIPARNVCHIHVE